MTVPRIWPHHAEELRASGLSGETIAAARIRSVTNAEAMAIVGFGRSAGYVIPYLHTDGAEPFTRVKFDKPGTNGRRYAQAKGSGNRLYIPPDLDPAKLKDPTITLYITEGEKKALKGAQEGLACVSVSGVDSWKCRVDGRSQPIADLDRIDWKGREAFIVFDSDVVEKPRVQWAEFTLAGELIRRGAKVMAIRLPAELDGKKVGLDDFLVSHSVETFCQLEPVPITRPSTKATATVEASGAEPLPPEAPEVDLPAFPEQAFVGVAGEVASTYAERLEAPVQFFYVDYLAYLGAMVCQHVRPAIQLHEEPRLYAVKLGESWLARKSSSQDQVAGLLAPLLQDRVTVCSGAGSAEGLAKRMKTGLSTILQYDELRAFVDKAQIQGSVLLPMVTTLFHRMQYDNATRHSEISLPDAHLSLVAACTIDTFRSMFTPQFRAIGFLNRLLIVAGRRGPLRPRPEPIPGDILSRLRDRTLAQVEAAARDKPRLPFAAAAGRRWDAWYRAMPESPYCARLDTYGLRVLTLFAVTTETREITLPLVDAVIPLLDYVLALRRELDPVDAETTVARVEQAILRTLRKGRMTLSRLRDYCHVERTGLWAFDQAMNNLRRQDWIASRRAGKAVECWLTEAGQEAARDR